MIIVAISFFLVGCLEKGSVFGQRVRLCSGFRAIRKLLPSTPIFVEKCGTKGITRIMCSTRGRSFAIVYSVGGRFEVPRSSGVAVCDISVVNNGKIEVSLKASRISTRSNDALTPTFRTNLVSKLSTKVTPLLTGIASALSDLRLAVSNVGSMLSSRGRTGVAGAVTRLREAVTDVRSVTIKVSNGSTRLATFVSGLSSVSKGFASVDTGVSAAVSNISSMITALSRSSVRKLIASFGSLLRGVGSPRNAIKGLLASKSICASVSRLLGSISSLMGGVRRGPGGCMEVSMFWDLDSEGGHRFIAFRLFGVMDTTFSNLLSGFVCCGVLVVGRLRVAVITRRF